ARTGEWCISGGFEFSNWSEADLTGKAVLDFGCGSGVLAIAALLLGAGNATGTDIDPQALSATMDNAERNGLSERIAVHAAEGYSAAPYDLVMANILSGPLVELADVLLAHLRVGGHLVLSGLLAEQAAAVMAAYPCVDFDEPAILDGWCRLSGKRSH
ncbi:MAG: DUF6505 family protein, partial [Litorivicinus sp.]